MNFPGLVTLWLASGLAMAFAAFRFGGAAMRQLARPGASRRQTPRR